MNKPRVGMKAMRTCYDYVTIMATARPDQHPGRSGAAETMDIMAGAEGPGTSVAKTIVAET